MRLCAKRERESSFLFQRLSGGVKGHTIAKEVLFSMMNFNEKKGRKIFSRIIIIALIIAMVVPMVLSVLISVF